MRNIWGFSERTKGLWNTSNVGDILAFYVTMPVKRIIGFGGIKQKLVDETVIWEDEKMFKRAIWKYRIIFDVIYVTPKWQDGIMPPADLMLNVGRKKISKKQLTLMVKQADRNWRTGIMKMLP